MEVPCDSCGATLKVNPKLHGTTMGCPKCHARFTVPSEPPPRAAAPAPRRRTRAAPPAPEPEDPPPPYSGWLFGAQAVLIASGGTCLAGALFRSGWNPPPWSVYMEHPVWLALSGVGLCIAALAARHLPVFVTLIVACVTLGACAVAYKHVRVVDASRTLLLAAAMLALWLALQHRRATT